MRRVLDPGPQLSSSAGHAGARDRSGIMLIAAIVAALTMSGCTSPAVSTLPATSGPGSSPGATSPSRPSAGAPRLDGWLLADPESEGFDSAILADGLRRLAADHSPIHSLLIARHGRIVLDAYAYPYDGSTYHDLASVTKSITTTLIGIAADRGLLDLDAPMLSFFPERTIANRTERKERITVRHLASMTSGLDCRFISGETTLDEMLLQDDWVQFALDLDTVADPGERFAYCSPGMHLLSAILTQATGQSALDFARVNLFEQLGISEAYWPADASGISHGWGALALQPRDAARIGQLFLAGGRWADAQVVSSDWVRAATSAHAATGGFKAEDYGYGWWVGRPGLEPMPFFRADGNGGQRILVVPELELVVVATGGGYSFEEVTELVIASATDDWRPLAADPAGVAALREAVEVLSVPPPGERVAALPSIAATLSGRTIRFEDNGFAIRTLRVDWSDGMAEAIVVLDAMNESPVREMLVGLDGLWRMSRAGRPIAARGGWLDERTFSIEVDEGPGIARYTLRIVVEADRVLLEVRGVTVVGHVVR